MKTSMILARSFDNVIGVDNNLPWQCKEDLKLFKEITSRPGVAIAMGRKTWESLPMKPLPGRLNIVITSNPVTLEIGDKTVIVSSIETARTWCEINGIDELIFIGGKTIYDEVVKFVDEVHLSEMNLVVGDVDGEKVIFDTDFVYACWPDQENSEWLVLENKLCHDGVTGKELFEYIHLSRR